MLNTFYTYGKTRLDFFDKTTERIYTLLTNSFIRLILAPFALLTQQKRRSRFEPFNFMQPRGYLAILILQAKPPAIPKDDRGPYLLVTQIIRLAKITYA